jgi:hypothetical protein
MGQAKLGEGGAKLVDLRPILNYEPTVLRFAKLQQK